MQECDICGSRATHVLVDFNHNVIQPQEVFCKQHAFTGEREKCPCCDDYTVECDDNNLDKIELLATYEPGTLDTEGCCSEHP